MIPITNLKKFLTDTKEERVFVITGCSARKNNTDNLIYAQNLYAGNTFKLVKKICKKYDIKFGIIPAKYGYIEANKLISTYNKVLKTQTDIDNISNQVSIHVTRISQQYDKILIIAGDKYRRTINVDPITNRKIYYVKSRGIGYLNGILKGVLTNV